MVVRAVALMSLTNVSTLHCCGKQGPGDFLQNGLYSKKNVSSPPSFFILSSSWCLCFSSLHHVVFSFFLCFPISNTLPLPLLSFLFLSSILLSLLSLSLLSLSLLLSPFPSHFFPSLHSSPLFFSRLSLISSSVSSRWIA